MDKDIVINIFKETEVLMDGHFLLTSGRHSDKYIQCAKITQYPDYTEEIVKLLAGQFKNKNIDYVVGPAIGGIILSYEMARQLGVKSLFAEREDGKMTFRRGFNLPKGSNVLIVEDVVTTGGSVREVMDLVRELDSNIQGVACLVDRSNGTIDFETSFVPALAMDVKSYNPHECPLCRADIPLVKMGSRKI
ncbi:MAG TPA: orotate phosphoribosyltransferase [Clostridiales bacterium]|nr:orotate phosphoribosyltransferase [Clostridiales bacterium]